MRTSIRILPLLVSLGLTAAALIAQEPRPLWAPPPPVRPVPDAFGTAHDSYVTVAEWEFTPAYSAWGWVDNGGSQPLKSANSSESFFFAAPHVPTGALITSLELDYCDSDPNADIGVQLFETDSLNHLIVTLGSVGSSGTPGCASGTFDVGQYGFVMDNLENRLLLDVTFGAAGPTTALAGVIIGYRLQVSPPPGTATFNDVPTSHPFFQYVEALNAAGITGGCGNGNYCPDTPLTRGQMAVFLAKALGLFWSH